MYVYTHTHTYLIMSFPFLEAMIIPGCCSQSNWWAADWGRVAHSLSSGLIACVVL